MLLTVKTHAPCRVFDADGVEIQYAFEADTETGVVKQFIVQDGKPAIDPLGRTALTQTVRYKAPLRWEPIVEKGGE